MSPLCFFFHSQGNETPLWPQRNSCSWSLAAALAPFCPTHEDTKVLLDSLLKTNCCSLISQRWVLGRTFGALRLIQLSCGCWTQSYTWWRSWRSGWVSELRVSGSFQGSCIKWQSLWRSWTGLSSVQDWTTSASSTRWGLPPGSSIDHHWHYCTKCKTPLLRN